MKYIYKKVGSITFGLLSSEMIRKMAVCKVVTPELYDKEGYPVDGGLMDVRMGVIDPGLVCPTDGKKLRDCPGYFGYIELARPVVHIKYVDVILAILRSFCSECNKILMTEEKLGASKLNKKELMAKLRNIKKCPHCQVKQYTVKIEKPTSFVENDRRLSPIQVKSRFEKISDDDLRKFGIDPQSARPEWMILTDLPVPPVTTRPSITLETGERSEDDLTHKLSDIVRINQRLFENINAGAPEIIVEDLWDLLQYHITTYFDNSISSVPPARHRGGQPLKTLTERIKSKEGRFRHNLAGKRVNFSARTFITPDPRIKFNEVGVPLIVAKELTVPERVTEWNLNYLKKFVENGSEIYPGANYFFSLDGKKKKITEDTKEQILEEFQIGCYIERHLLDGDTVVFNRQPSLHRMSIMCHKVRILPGKSFRLNPSVCNPYNADFDGDEMNLHVPQTEEARAEAEILMEVENHIISPKNGLNVIGTTTDAITGNFLLTKYMKISREEAVDILYSIGISDFSNLKSGKILEGKDVFSAILPKDLSFIGTSKEKHDVIIKNGKLIEGVIDKATIGEDNGTLIRRLHAVYGAEEGIELINKIFRLGVEILLRKGFTSSISDTDLSKDVIMKNKEKLIYVENKVNEIIEEHKTGKLELLPGMDEYGTVETLILRQLNQLRDKIGENVYENVSENNPTIIMARSGAKGNFLNLAQMSAMVGQQAMGEGRINMGYKGRTLSTFKRNSLSPESRGFIKNGYKQGLTPVEFFFHSITGRDSLMDTALRTPKSGYLYRRLANALQDMRIEYDNTLRDASGKIIQFKFGDDGLDVSKTEGGKINVQRIVREVKANV
ncbi:DNA-directed RNA polymerase subunit A' [Candidatus Woesearchaeota archaeon]|nr:DNA-directed RNA polymerase subunit A' [Candidatus Woesearchaeota archaeon]